jgi:predicted XRE-type DNA-binding protein
VRVVAVSTIEQQIIHQYSILEIVTNFLWLDGHRFRNSSMSDDLKVRESSGNIFQDLGAREAEERLAKAELARVIRRETRERGLTQVGAAELLGITQPDVSDLVRGKLARFSIERLERLLNALDMEVRIQVRPKPKDKERAGISVELVSSF